MRKSKMVPPRKPKGEPAKITIANLERQVLNLTQRCATLLEDRDHNYKSGEQWRDKANVAEGHLETARQFKKADNARLEEAQAKLASTEQRFEGYRQAIEDIVRT